MYEAIKKVVEYGNKAWRGFFNESTIDEFTTELCYSITQSNRHHIDDLILHFLSNLAEDCMNGSEEAEHYYEAIMDYIMAE